MNMLKRKRLTSERLFPRGRKAAPDANSGRNLNTPIQLYDIKPNARFVDGEEVIPLTTETLPVKGIVLGHVAEDRVWVQWPTMIKQEDTDDIGRLSEHPFFGGNALESSAGRIRAHRRVRADKQTLFESLPKDQDPNEKLELIPEEEAVPFEEVDSPCGLEDPIVEIIHDADLVEGLLQEPVVAKKIRKAARTLVALNSLKSPNLKLGKNALKAASRDLLEGISPLEDSLNPVGKGIANKILSNFLKAIPTIYR